MRIRILLLAGLFLPLIMFAGQNKSGPTIPQTFPPPEPDRPHLQLDQPPTVVRADRRAPSNAAQMEREADELAKLAESIRPDVKRLGKGELQQDLEGRLKQIEKLSKQLRREVSQ
ncbi:MAG TPA: hypothetical protein VG860_00955 [Terriglobia bacterium]|jgi:hypothetical protein|nr:hypothetical protein [Terriglobia bacterium]